MKRTVLVPILLGAALALAAGPRAATVRAADAAAAPAPGTRVLLLVRHGAYDESDPRDADIGKGLVALGREQAQAVARRLAAWPQPVTGLRSSTMTRARETAEIVGRTLRLEPLPDPLLRECTPPTPRADVMKDLGPGEADSCVAQLERAWARYFRPTAGGDSVEVLVAHGNLIRYLVCRALGVDPSGWLRMGIANCSVTEIEVRPDGAVRLISFDDVGHLSKRLQTRTGNAMRATRPANAR